jgi:general secretion pathway protein G
MTQNGFSKISLLIAVAVTVLLASIAVPKMRTILSKANEDATKAGLSSLRSAIAIYYGEHNGAYPDENIVKELVEDGQYIEKIPYVYLDHHKKSNKILLSNFAENPDSGQWAYKADNTDDLTGRVKGEIWINCAHKDSLGNVWSEL